MGYRKPRCFTPSQVRLIRSKMASGVSDLELASEHRVSRSTIGKIRRGVYVGMKSGTAFIPRRIPNTPPNNAYDLPDDLYDVLVAIYTYMRQHAKSPLYDDIGTLCFLSKPAVHRKVAALRASGFITQVIGEGGRALPRTIQLTDKSQIQDLSVQIRMEIQ